MLIFSEWWCSSEDGALAGLKVPRGWLASSLSFPQSGEYLDNDHEDHQNDGEDDQEDYHDDYDAVDMGSKNNSASNCVVEIQTTMNQRKHLHTGTKRATGVMGLFREFWVQQQLRSTDLANVSMTSVTKANVIMTSVTMTKTSFTSPMFLFVIATLLLLPQTMIGFASAEPISTVLPSEVSSSKIMLMKMMPMMTKATMRAQKFDQFLTLKNTQEPDSEGVLEDAVLEHMVSSLMKRYDHTYVIWSYIIS